jgi:uncharacterized cupin superfamily protein
VSIVRTRIAATGTPLSVGRRRPVVQRVRIDDVDDRVNPATVLRPLTEALGCTDLAINYYELAPGDSFAYAYHRHEVQEEVFYVQSGTATFETSEGDVRVGPGEAVRFPPGEFQRGWNRGDERVVALALGAPLEYGRQVKLRDCPTCGERTDNALERPDEADGDVVVAVCKACGTETGRWTRDD